MKPAYNFRTGTDSRHILGILVRLNYLRTAFHRDVNGLKRICPKPMIWADLHKKLLNHARDHHCLPEEPPKPVILAAWAHTTDIDKLNRWRETMRWCAENGCSEILRDLPYKHYYTVKEESS